MIGDVPSSSALSWQAFSPSARSPLTRRVAGPGRADPGCRGGRRALEPLRRPCGEPGRPGRADPLGGHQRRAPRRRDDRDSGERPSASGSWTGSSGTTR
ncbi:MAG: hypothetical protein MZU95_01495 [Desulfomicrobium escambiense]|nr:hypothetical protein [Desulfomicrobium escambiense]